MEQHVRKMPHIFHTSASVHLASLENTVKPVSSVIAYLEQISVITYAILPFPTIQMSLCNIRLSITDRNRDRIDQI